MTGDPAAVSGFPHHHARDRLSIEDCCTLQLGRDARSRQLQGVDSVMRDVSGPGYVLQIVFGAYDGSRADPGYRLAGGHTVDGVQRTFFRWAGSHRKPPEGRLLWLAQVGGRRIAGVNHMPWSLRIMGQCDSPGACRAATALVDTIRF